MNFKYLKKILFFLLFFSVMFFPLAAQESPYDAEPLEPEEAFNMDHVVTGPHEVIFRWQIPKFYYLYKDKFTFGGKDFNVKEIKYIPHETKEDPFFGATDVFHDVAEITLNLSAINDGKSEGILDVTYQGCWEGGICYPLAEVQYPISGIVSDADSPSDSVVDKSLEENTEPLVAPKNISEQDQFALALTHDSLWITLISFFVAGLALAFTPCVFPMVPILSSIIAGEGDKVTTKKSFLLSLDFVLAMALTYTLLGVIAGLFGANLQATFQAPWIITSFSLLFVILSFSMFGLYELQIPVSMQKRLTLISKNQEGGTYLGVGIMGVLSAIIVGPCVAAPLAGALIYIGQTGNPVIGGLALFALSIGMGIPLLVVGASAGKILPKTGPWMVQVKAFFGICLLALAIWMMDRVVDPLVTMLLSSILLIVSGVYMGAFDSINTESSGWKKLWKGLGLIAVLCGTMLIIGAASGSKSLFYPLDKLATSGKFSQPKTSLKFETVYSLEETQKKIAAAKAEGKPVLLDFYADWCVSCKEWEFLTFKDPKVQQALSGFVLLKADVTENDAKAKKLNKHYEVIGPPALFLYDHSGNIRNDLTIVGVMGPDEFIKHLQLLKI